MRVLVKTGGSKKHHPKIHAYNAKTNSALCAAWPRPPDDWEQNFDWEIQEVDDWKAVPCQDRCDHCSTKLTPKPPGPPRPTSALKRRQQRDLEKLAAWNAQMAPAL